MIIQACFLKILKWFTTKYNEIFKNKLEDLEINVDNFLQNISNKETKEKLIKLTQDAYNKKIFGAPTFICNNKIFWGQDRLDYAIEEFSN